MDWSTLLTPVIVAVIPLLVLLAKKVIPDRYAALYPVLATVLGPVLDYLSTYLSAQPASPGRGILMGMAAVALREIIDQVRKVPSGPAIPPAKLMVLALALLALTGCSGAASMIEALGKDPATVCVNVGTVYGTIKMARTNITNGDVKCDGDGLTVKSQATTLGVPISVVPSISVGTPTVTRPAP